MNPFLYASSMHAPYPCRYGADACTYRPYPPVNTSLFMQSIHVYQRLLQSADRMLVRLAQPAFASQLMAAAQAGNKQSVERMLEGIAGNSTVVAKYTPSGISFVLADREDASCCTLTMYLKWGA